MDKVAKRNMLASLLAPETETDEVLDTMITLAEAEILNRLYPFGWPVRTVPPAVPFRYESLQVQLALELYSKRGAEGQTMHSENGISRSWPEKSALLAKIVPFVGSVSSDA